MTKYSRRDNNGSILPKAGIFAAIMAVLYFGYQFLNPGKVPASPNAEPTTQSSHPANTPDGNIPPGPGDIPGTPARPEYLPSGDNGTIVQHQYYTLSYNEDHEQANWVAYELTREQLNSNRVERSDEFRSDPAISVRAPQQPGIIKGRDMTADTWFLPVTVVFLSLLCRKHSL
jgi:DNA/RNA endonuclease G (NUC1)